ncbi:MAG: DMT family transporter [Magnetococcales bacterium]|nr:DMT family transporter [Magnetococcales bacterium]
MIVPEIAVNNHILAIASAFFGALSNILAKTILKDVTAKDILGVNFLIMTGIMALLSPAFFEINGSLSVVIPLVVLISVVDFFANYFFFKSFEKSDVSVVTPMLALAPGFTFLFAWLFLGESVTWMQLILSIGVVAGIVAFSADFSKLRESLDNTLLPAITASLLFGFSAIPSKYLLSHGMMNAPTLYELRGAIIGLSAIMIFGSGINQLTASHFRKILVRGVFVIVQWLLLYFALTNGKSGVTLTLGNITPIFVFLLGVLFLKESITKKKLAAALSVLILSLLVIKPS